MEKKFRGKKISDETLLKRFNDLKDAQGVVWYLQDILGEFEHDRRRKFVVCSNILTSNDTRLFNQLFKKLQFLKQRIQEKVNVCDNKWFSGSEKAQYDYKRVLELSEKDDQ